MIQRIMCGSRDEASDFFASLTHIPEHPVFGQIIPLDIETSSTDTLTAELAGFSIYNRVTKISMYFPIGHKDPITCQLYSWNLAWADVSGMLNSVTSDLSTCILMHNGCFDMGKLMRLGITFNNTLDTYILAVMLQCMNLGLKDLTLEYHLADFKDVISYQALIAQTYGLTVEQVADLSKAGDPRLSFCLLDLTTNPRAVQYACDDPYYTDKALEVLLMEYLTRIGNDQLAYMNLNAQCDANLLLVESSTPGFIFDKPVLDQFITDFTIEVEGMEASLKNDVREAMGWVTQPPKEVQQPSQTAPSVFDIINQE